MTLYNSHSSSSVSKSVLAGTALVVAVFVSGCDKKDTATDTTTDTAATTETVATTTSTKTDTNSSEATTMPAATTTEASTPVVTETSTLAQISSDTLNSMVFEPIINSGQLTAEQKSCLEARDKNIGLAESQAYFESKLTKEELDELNAFYSSDIGKKLLAYGNEQLQTLNGQQVTNPLPAPSEQEMAEMQQFMQSPVGQKYMALNNAEGAGSMYEALNPTIQAEFSRCKIDMNS